MTQFLMYGTDNLDIGTEARMKTGLSVIVKFAKANEKGEPIGLRS